MTGLLRTMPFFHQHLPSTGELLVFCLPYELANKEADGTIAMRQTDTHGGTV